jgi:hypothetical protein
VPRQPPSRPIAVNAIGSTSVADPATERAFVDLREQVDRLRSAVARTPAASAAFTVTEDLEFNDFSALEVHTMQMTELGATPGVPNRIYMIGDDWYVSDGNGNEIQITSGGALAVAGDDLYGDREYILPLRDFTLISGTVGGPHNGYTRVDVTAASSILWGPMQLRVGERIKSFRCRIQKNATATTTIRVQVASDGGGLSDTGGSVTSNTSGLQTLSHTLSSPVTVTAPSTNYYIRATMPQSGDSMYVLYFTVDKVV